MGGDKLPVGEVPLKLMFRLSSGAGGHETGGILIGRYGDDGATASVDEAMGPPSDSKAGPSWFERGKQGLAELLRERWEAEDRRFYVGEWHFHTTLIPWPSPQDRRQMTAVSADVIYRCEQPILVIICPVNDGHWAVKVFVFPWDGTPSELRMTDEVEVEDEPGDEGEQ